MCKSRLAERLDRRPPDGAFFGCDKCRRDRAGVAADRAANARTNRFPPSGNRFPDAGTPGGNPACAGAFTARYRARFPIEISDGANTPEIAVKGEIVEARKGRTRRRRQTRPALDTAANVDRCFPAAGQERDPHGRTSQFRVRRLRKCHCISPVSAIGGFARSHRSAHPCRHRRVEHHGPQPRRLPCGKRHARGHQGGNQDARAPKARAVPECEKCHAENAHQQCKFKRARRLRQPKPHKYA